MDAKIMNFKNKLLDALQNMKVVRVEVGLSLKHVHPWATLTNEYVQSCLWPRVTLEVHGKQKTFSMTELLGLSPNKLGPGELNLWEDIAIRFCGGSKKSSMVGGVRHAVMQAGHMMRNRVTTAIVRTAKTKKIHERIEKRWVSERRKRARQALHTYFLGSYKEYLEYLSPHDVARTYREAKNLSVVQHVLET